jgi:pimeloyl-ACP methyl ester carboxylesterase
MEGPTAERWQVVLLPGVVLPATPAYAALLTELGEEVDARPKDLEVYAGDSPPADFSLETETDGIARAADEAGFQRFHLLGYSGGGAASLAFAATYPERLLSLALFEPAWAGNEGLSAAEVELNARFAALRGMSPEQLMAAFTRLQLKPGVSPPPRPDGPAPPWMAKRPAGVSAFLNAFESGRLDLPALRQFERPVYFGLGGLSNPDYFARMAERLGRVFTDFTVEVYSDRHHFDPPHRAEPARVAGALRGFWQRAEPLPTRTR